MDTQKVTRIKELRAEILQIEAKASKMREQANEIAKELMPQFLDETQKLIKEKFGLESVVDYCIPDYTGSLYEDGLRNEIQFNIQGKEGDSMPTELPAFVQRMREDFNWVREDEEHGDYYVLSIYFDWKDIPEEEEIAPMV